MLKRALQSAYLKAPEIFKRKLRNFANTDGFHTRKAQDFLDSAFALSVPITDKAQQKTILKRYLQMVEVEVASFCNRTCWFCPNSHIDRKSTSIELPESTFLKILDNLAEIEYDQNFNFHRFNEPLANRELILKRIAQARQKLPKARFTIFTNGDYAQREYFEALRDAGVNHILMSYYYGKEKCFDKEQTILPAMKKMSQKLSLPYEVMEDSVQEYRVRFEIPGLNIDYRVWNPDTSGQSRGGSLESMKRARRVDSGCFQPAISLYVDYNGLVMPCCHTRSDERAHEDFILGDCNTHDVFEVFFGERAASLRRGLFSSTPCGNGAHAESIARICADCSDRRRDWFCSL